MRASLCSISSALCYIWLGLILGVSLFATPIKFMASVPFEYLLMVGQVTLQGFKWIERAIFALIIFLLIVEFRTLARSIIGKVLIVGLAILFLTQQCVVLPILDQRMIMRLSGHPLSDSNWHEIFIGIEVVKLFAITSIAVFLNYIGEKKW